MEMVAATSIVTTITARLVNGLLTRIYELQGSRVPSDSDLDEHLRHQPTHYVADLRQEEAVAFVKKKGLGEQWYQITYSDSCSLTVETVPTVSMAWKKRVGEARGLKTAWVRLQTGQLPLLATEKSKSTTGKDKFKWNKLPLAQASRSGSWLQLCRLLGTFSPSDDYVEKAFVAMPVVVLFALLSTAADSCDRTLSLELQAIDSLIYTMKLGNIPEDIVLEFSRILNAGVTFVVRSKWCCAALFDTFEQSGLRRLDEPS